MVVGEAQPPTARPPEEENSQASEGDSITVTLTSAESDGGSYSAPPDTGTVMAELIMPGDQAHVQSPSPAPGDVQGRLERFATVENAPAVARVRYPSPTSPQILSPLDRLRFWFVGGYLLASGQPRTRRRQAAGAGLLSGAAVGLTAALVATAWQERESVVGLTVTAIVTASSLFVWWRTGSTTTAAAHLGALLLVLWMLTPASRIIYESDRDTGYRPQIYVTTAGGGSTDRLSSSPSLEMEAQFAPATRQIVLTHFQDGNSDIFVTEADGANPRNLTRHPAEDRAPTWSPDGSEVAFQSNRSGNWDVYVMRADGTDLRKLTSSAADDEAPAWSPNGDTLAFQSDRTGFTHVYVLGPRGTVVPLTRGLHHNQHPAWSPDGNHIAFQSQRDGRWQIYVMTASGTDLRRLSTSSGNDTLPAWSPTGRSVVFSSDRDGNLELYSTRADGGSLRRITDTPTDERRPAWPSSGLVNWVAVQRTLVGWLSLVAPSLRPAAGVTTTAPPALREEPAGRAIAPGEDVLPGATPRPAQPVGPGLQPPATPVPGPRPVPTCAPGSFWC